MKRYRISKIILYLENKIKNLFTNVTMLLYGNIILKEIDFLLGIQRNNVTEDMEIRIIIHAYSVKRGKYEI